MFKQRLVTALVLVPLVLAILFYGNTWLLATVTLVIYLGCAWEWNKLIPVTDIKYKILFLVVSLLTLWACGEVYDYWQWIGFALWFLIMIAIVTYPASMSIWGKKTIVIFAGLLLLPLFTHSLVKVYTLPMGKGLLLYLLLLIWTADSGAYLVGKLCGQHKLIPKVSPGKSWEGVLGGIIMALLVSLAAFYYFKHSNLFCWMVLAFIIVIISIFGDLFISVLKRRCNLKDTGAILPGHGGALDRLDSLIAALPFYYFGLTTFSFGF